MNIKKIPRIEQDQALVDFVLTLMRLGIVAHMRCGNLYFGLKKYWKTYEKNLHKTNGSSKTPK